MAVPGIGSPRLNVLSGDHGFAAKEQPAWNDGTIGLAAALSADFLAQLLTVAPLKQRRD